MKLKSTYLIGLQAILFVTFLLITFFFNRFAVDDYYFIGELNTSSFKEIYNHLYNEWHGRWTSNFLLLFLLEFNKVPLFLFAYNLFSVGLLYLGASRMLSSINTYYQLNFEKRTVLTYSIVFVTVLFFCTVSANDTWLWYTSSIVYLWSVTAFFFGMSILIKKEINFLDWLIILVCSIYIGGANEPVAIACILVLSISLIKGYRYPKIWISLLLVLGAFLINYLSPGTQHRDDITEPLGNFDPWLYSGYATVDYLFRNFHTTFLPALFLSLPFYLLGKQTTASFTKFHPVKQLFISLLLIGFVTFFNQMLAVQALGSLPPHRASMMSTVFIALVMVRYLFLLGNYHQEKYKKLKYLLILNVTVLIGFNLYFANIHSHYAKAVDGRNGYIQICRSQLIQVEPLPNSGYIYSAEISGDQDNFKNQHLKKGLGINKDIVMVKIP